jgi:hypothetical protein
LCVSAARRVAGLGAPRAARLVKLLADAMAPAAAAASAAPVAGSGAAPAPSPAAPFTPPPGVVEELSRAASGAMPAFASAATLPGGGGLPRLAWAAGVVGLRLANSARDDLMRRLYAPVAAAAAAAAAADAAAAEDAAAAPAPAALPPGDAARALWAGAALGGRWLTPQLVAFEAATAPALGDLDGAGAALLLRGFALSGHRPSPPWLRAFAAAGLDGARLADLGAGDALGVLRALRDAAGGGGANGGEGRPAVGWLAAWAAALPAGQLLSLPTGDLALLVGLLGDAAGPATSDAAASDAGDAGAPTGDALLGLLGLALSRAAGALSGAEVAEALAGLGALAAARRAGDQNAAPLATALGDSGLLPALAVRAAEKMPALDAAAAARLVRAFAELGFRPGGPGRLVVGAGGHNVPWGCHVHPVLCPF